MDLKQKDYIVVIQCHIVRQRCPGYLCEKAFNERTGGFAEYPADKKLRLLTMTCGGCCGRAVHRKLTSFLRKVKKLEGMEKKRIVVQLSSCITKDNFHAPPCPHLDYINVLLKKLALDVRCDTVINEESQERRRAGLYSAGDP